MGVSHDIILRIEDLKTYFYTRQGVVKAVNGVSFNLKAGEILGIVGESGCGKSVTAFSILRVLPGFSGRIVDGRILFHDENLLEKSEAEMRQIRGGKIAMIPQNPHTSLNPVFAIGTQLKEVIDFHGRKRKYLEDAQNRILKMLTEVQIPSPEIQVRNFPFQLSGGMKQRVVIAMSLLCEPEIIIADEPTTALDVTIQAQILRLLKELREKHGTSIIIITHDLGVIARLCHTVAVMYAGRIVEYNHMKDLFQKPRHPYTLGLMKSNPVFGKKKETLLSMKGQPPDLINLPKGCPFEPRCSISLQVCKEKYPPKAQIMGNYYYACWLKDQMEDMIAR
jgi:oligopeptide/dipeptide ABC transporter ATP-binding protein